MDHRPGPRRKRRLKQRRQRARARRARRCNDSRHAGRETGGVRWWGRSQTAGGFNGGGNVNSGSQDDYLDYKGYAAAGRRTFGRAAIGYQTALSRRRRRWTGRLRLLPPLQDHRSRWRGRRSTAGSGKTGYTPWCYQSRSESWPGLAERVARKKPAAWAASAEEVTLELPATRGSPAAAETEAPASRAAPGHLVRRARVVRRRRRGRIFRGGGGGVGGGGDSRLAAVAAAGEGPLISSLTRKRFTVGEVGRMQPEAASSY